MSLNLTCLIYTFSFTFLESFFYIRLHSEQLLTSTLTQLREKEDELARFKSELGHLTSTADDNEQVRLCRTFVLI